MQEIEVVASDAGQPRLFLRGWAEKLLRKMRNFHSFPVVGKWAGILLSKTYCRPS